MKLITLLFITSCGINQLKPSYTKQYLVKYTYSCLENYNMAIDTQNRRFCVIKDNISRINRIEPKKTVKQAKKHFKTKNKCKE